MALDSGFRVQGSGFVAWDPGFNISLCVHLLCILPHEADVLVREDICGGDKVVDRAVRSSQALDVTVEVVLLCDVARLGAVVDPLVRHAPAGWGRGRGWGQGIVSWFLKRERDEGGVEQGKRG